MKVASALFVFLLMAQFGWTQTPRRQVAVTIDDLPVAQSGEQACEFGRLQALTERLLASVRQYRVPVTGFVIGGRCANLSASSRRAILRLWLDAGAELGNHTYSHHGLNNTPIAEYEQDILRSESALREALGSRPLHYFRAPMLQMGPDPATKKELEAFLIAHGYQNAPVTLDNSDWMFAYVYHDALERGDSALLQRVRESYVPYLESVIAFFEQRSVEVVGHEFPQALLLHASEMNAEMLPAVFAMLEKRGYQFIALDEALADKVYRLPNNYAGRGGFSWIHRWSQTKGMPNKGEPNEPEWLQKAYGALGQR